MVVVLKLGMRRREGPAVHDLYYGVQPAKIEK